MQHRNALKKQRDKATTILCSVTAQFLYSLWISRLDLEEDVEVYFHF
jgi:hypothetical protein